MLIAIVIINTRCAYGTNYVCVTLYKSNTIFVQGQDEQCCIDWPFYGKKRKYVL